MLSPFTSRTSCRTPSTLVDNLLRIPHKECMDSFDETYLHTSYEPNAYDVKETSVEPFPELLNSPPFSDKVFPRTPSTMTPHSRICCVKLTEYIAITLNEKTCLSVVVVSVRQNGWTLLDKQKEQILAECQAKINRHECQAACDRRSLLKLGEIVESQQEELHCARAEEVQQRDQRLLQGQLLQQNLEFREAHH